MQRSGDGGGGRKHAAMGPPARFSLAVHGFKRLPVEASGDGLMLDSSRFAPNSCMNATNVMGN